MDENQLKRLIDAINGIAANQSPAATPGTSEDAIKREQEHARLRYKAAIEDLKNAETREQLEHAELERKTTLIELLETRVNLTKKQKDVLVKLRKEVAKTTKERAKENEELQENIAAMNELATNLAGAIGMRKSLISTLGKAVKAWKSDTEAAEKNRDAIKDMFSAQNIAIATAAKAVEAGVAGMAYSFSTLEDLQAEYNKTTGRGIEESNRLRASWVELQPVGADIIGGLKSLESAFPTNQLADFGYGIAKSISLWEKFGVSTDVAAKNFADLSKAFGQDPFQAQETQREIMELAMIMRKPPQEMVSAFQDAMPRLALYTGQLKDNFTKLATASAQLTVPTDSILGFNDSLKTVAGSSEFAGKMNSILGQGLIDPMNMMRKAFEDPLAPLLEVRKAYRMAGKDITKVAGAELEMMASTMGVDGITFKKMMTGEMSLETVRQKLRDANMDERKIALNSSKTLEKIFNLLKFSAGAMFGKSAQELNQMLTGWLTAPALTPTGPGGGSTNSGLFGTAKQVLGTGAAGTGTIVGVGLTKHYGEATADLATKFSNQAKWIKLGAKGAPIIGAAASYGIDQLTGDKGAWESALGAGGSALGAMGGTAAAGALGWSTMGAGLVLVPSAAIAGGAGGEVLGSELGKLIDNIGNFGNSQLLTDATAVNAAATRENTQAINNLANAYRDSQQGSAGTYRIIGNALGEGF